MSGAHRLVEALEMLGVDIAFGLPGVHNLSIWNALARSRIRLVGVRHEQTAVYAADGYARATGRLGVAVVTSGPGAANTLAATGEAMASRSPVLVIATDIPTSLRRPGVYRGVLHETRDMAAMFAPVTKASSQVPAAADIGYSVITSGRLALAAATGPVYLGVPTDLLDHKAPPTRQLPPAPTPGGIDAAELQVAVDLLNGATRPLIWAGGGAVSAGAGASIGELANRLGAPVITTYMGRGVVPPGHPSAVTGPVHEPAVGQLWDDADVVLAIGTDFDGMMTQNWAMPPPRALVSVNIDDVEARKNYAPDVALIGDAREVVEILLTRVSTRPPSPHLRSTLDGIAAQVRSSVTLDAPGAQQLLAVMERCLSPETIVVADMCIPGYWLAGYRQVPLPRKLAYPVGWGTLGFAFPASLGAALADVGRVVCVVGDGGFLFACGELATIVDAQIPVTVVLVDDGGYGMLRFDQHMSGYEANGVDLARPDFSALVASFGIRVDAVSAFDDRFEQMLIDALAANEARVIIVETALKPPRTTSPRWYRRAAH